MGYRFPAEVQNDRVYVERMIMKQPNSMKTPAIERITDKPSQPGFKELLENSIQSSAKQKSFNRIYHELTGKGGKIDQTV